MGSLRTKEGKQKYVDYQKALSADAPCALCHIPAIKEFALWKIVENAFPYDKVSEVHHMIVPKRHTDEKGLSEEELADLEFAKESFVHPEYEFIIEATHKKKSIPGHFHLHLLIAKE